MTLCVIKEQGKTYSLIAKKWETISNRKEFVVFKEKASFILKEAEKAKMYCPDIFVEEGVFFISYNCDDKYIKFFITSGMIKYNIGTVAVEDYVLTWKDSTKMATLSNYLHGNYQLFEK